MITFISSIICLCLGAYLNNILFWKVKQKVECLDVILRQVIDYNSKFLEFIRLKCPIEDGGKSPSEDDYIEFGKYSYNIINDAYISNYIIYGSPEKCKDTNLYKSISKYYNFVAELVNKRDAGVLRDNFNVINNEPHNETNIQRCYQENMSACINIILTYRNKLTSLDFKFWIHELVCKNKSK